MPTTTETATATDTIITANKFGYFLFFFLVISLNSLQMRKWSSSSCSLSYQQVCTRLEKKKLNKIEKKNTTWILFTYKIQSCLKWMVDLSILQNLLYIQTKNIYTYVGICHINAVKMLYFNMTLYPNWKFV